MAEQKTKPTKQTVKAFLDKIDDEQVRDDCRVLTDMMAKITGEPPTMWGSSIVGFGKYHYKYESGHEGDSCIAAFSPRKQNLTVYLMPGFSDDSLLQKLGKHKSSKACLYFKRLDDIDTDVLAKLIQKSVRAVQKLYPDKK